MGVKTSGAFKRAGGDAKRKNKQFVTCITKAMGSAMRFGAEVGKDTIETSGTGYEGRRGRVKSGKMRDSFDGKVVDSNDTQVVGQLGWLSSDPFYAKYQEHGFTVSGHQVEGMMALRNAGEDVWDEFKRDANACVREIYG